MNVNKKIVANDIGKVQDAARKSNSWCFQEIKKFLPFPIFSALACICEKHVHILFDANSFHVKKTWNNESL